MKFQSLSSFVCVSLFAVGCASAVDTPSSCDTKNRKGQYFCEWTEESGDCGPQKSELIVLDGTLPKINYTTYNYANNKCRFNSTFSVTTSRGSEQYFTNYSDDINRNGSVLVGETNFSVYLSNGSNLCSSVYKIVCTRR